MSEQRTTGLRTVIVILLLLVVVIVTLNPMSRQQINTLGTESLEYEFGEVYLIEDAQGRQETPDVWGDLVVWADDRGMNMDIYCYNFSSDNVFLIDSDLPEETNPEIWNNTIGWYTTEQPSGHEQRIEGIFLNNLTEWNVEDVPVGGIEGSVFDVWGYEVVYEIDDSFYIHNITINTTTTLRHDIFTSTILIERYDDRVMVLEYEDTSDVRWYCHNITTNQTLQVDIQSGSFGSGDVWGDYYAYYLCDSAGREINVYNMRTGQTTHIVENATGTQLPDDNTHVDVWGEWVVWNQMNDAQTGYNIFAYNMETEDLISSDSLFSGGVKGLTVWDGIVVFTNKQEDFSTDYDIYYMEIVGSEVVEPTTGLDNWLLFIIVVAVSTIVSFLISFYLMYRRL